MNATSLPQDPDPIATQAAADIAAARIRQSVNPDGGRREGRATNLPTGILGAPFATIKRFMDLAAAHRPGETLADDPNGDQYAKAAAGTALNVVGLPGITGGVPANSLGSAAASFPTLQEFSAAVRRGVLGPSEKEGFRRLPHAPVELRGDRDGTLIYHADMGRNFGYAPDDIAHFLAHRTAMRTDPSYMADALNVAQLNAAGARHTMRPPDSAIAKAYEQIKNEISEFGPPRLQKIGGAN